MSQAADTPSRPFVGLRNYEEWHARLFFGRDGERRVLIGNLVTARFTVLYAQSGAGKSSLLRAGVMPKLQERATSEEDDGLPRFMPLILNSWSVDPIASIRSWLTEVSGVSEVTDEPLDQLIERAAAELDVTFLIILDQFEEFFVNQRERAQEEFAEAIGRCVTRAELPVNFLVAIREDALSRLGSLFKRWVPNVYGNYLQLLPLDVSGARQAIEKPLEQFDVTADEELVAKVLDGIRQPGEADAGGDGASGGFVAAPYLQLVMDAVWDARDGARVLHTNMLPEGGTKEIIANHVSDALDLPDEQKQIAAEALRYLVPSDQGKLTLTVDQLEEFTHYSRERLLPVLKRLYEKRIVAAGDAEDSYELFHDDLAVPVNRWRRDYQRELQTRKESEEREKRLEAEKREDEERTAKLRAERLVRALVAAGIVILAAVAFAIVEVILTQQANNRAESEQLGNASLQISNPELAALYALEGYQIQPTFDAERAILRLAGSHQRGRPFAADQGGINGVAWSADNKTLAVAGGNAWVSVWNVYSHDEIKKIPPPGLGDALQKIPHLQIIGANIGAVVFSPDARRLAWGQNIEYYDAPNGNFTVLATVKVWDMRTGHVSGLPAGKGRISGLAFSPDGGQLASASGEISGHDAAVRLWNVGRHDRVAWVRKGVGAVNSVAFSPDGKTLASSSCDEGDHDNHEDTADHVVSLWNTRRGRLVARLRGSMPICGVAFGPRAQVLVAASDDRTITVWDTRRRQPIEPPLVGHTDVLNAVAISPDGKTVASASRDHTVRLWDLANHRELDTPLIHTGDVRSVSFSPDGTMLASGGVDGVRVWSTAGPEQVRVLPTAHQSDALSIAYSRDGRYIAWTDDLMITPKRHAPFSGSVQVWDTQQRKLLPTITEPTDNINSIAFGPDSRTLAWAASDDHSVWIWDLTAGHRVHRIPAPSGNIVTRRLAMSPDGKTVAFDVTAGEQTTIELGDVQHGGNPVPIPVAPIAPSSPTGELGAMAFGPDGNTLVTGGTDRTVRLWDVRRRRQIGSPLNGGGAIYGIAVSPDGRTIATGGGDQTVRLWDVASHKERGGPLTEHTGPVYAVAFSRDGMLLASASLDDTVRVWDVHSEQLLLTFTGHSGFVFGVAFSPHGNNTIASAGGDGTVRLWSNFSLDASKKRLCSYIDKRTAPALWHQYEPSIGYQQPC